MALEINDTTSSQGLSSEESHSNAPSTSSIAFNWGNCSRLRRRETSSLGVAMPALTRFISRSISLSLLRRLMTSARCSD